MGSRGPARSRRQEALNGLDAAVTGGALADLAVALNGFGGLVEHRRETQDPLTLGTELEEALLDLGAEIDARSDLVRDRVRVEVELLEVCLGGADDALVGGEALLDLVLGRRLVLVVDVLNLGGHVRVPLGELGDADPLAALDDDVQPPVVELLQHLDHTCAAADLAHAVVVRKHEPELASLLEAFADQLAVPGLEDVQRRLLAREQHEVEGEEADLHGMKRLGEWPTLLWSDPPFRASSPTSRASPSRKCSASSASSAWSSSPPTRASTARFPRRSRRSSGVRRG